MTSRTLRPAVSMLLLMTLLLGVIYPLLVTGAAQLLFPVQAGGSLIYRNQQAVGSALIGQSFTSPRYFWGRPSATAERPYNGQASGGSNLGPLNPALVDGVRARVQQLRALDPLNVLPIPVDLVTASASGLDPDISLAAALYQAPRLARERAIPLARLQALIDAQAHNRLMGFIGEPRVNVLQLNLALDDLK